MDARHELLLVLQGSAKSMALNSLCKLGIPDILSRPGGSTSFMCVEEIAKLLPGDHVDTAFLARVLYSSVSFGFLAGKSGDASEEGRTVVTRLYGLNALSSLLVKDGNPACLVPILTMEMHPVFQAPWHHLADAVLTGTYPFAIAHGKNIWEKAKEDSEWNTMISEGLEALTSLLDVAAMVDKYEGFKDIKTLVDVGGGTGRMVQEIVKHYPHIHGIVFDLPHVIAKAPPSPVEGVEYVAGDMFESVPSADAILMKLILHDWDDERCTQVLRNCMKALPDHGKVIISDMVVPEEDDNPFKAIAVWFDLMMMVQCEGGKERTKVEWTKLLSDAGFARVQFVQIGTFDRLDQWFIEGYKK